MTKMNLPPSYLGFRDEMKSGDLVEWQSQGALGWLIRKFTGKDVNHTSLVIRPDALSGYRDRRFALEALEHGVTPTLLSEKLRNYKGRAYWVPLRSELDPKREHLKEIAIIRMCEYRPEYDYINLLKQTFMRVSLDAERFFCSEWAQWVWTQAGIVPREKKALRPGEFGRFRITRPRQCIFDSEKESVYGKSKT